LLQKEKTEEEIVRKQLLKPSEKMIETSPKPIETENIASETHFTPLSIETVATNEGESNSKEKVGALLELIFLKSHFH